MNDEAKILYLKKLTISLTEDIDFLEVLLSKLDNFENELRDDIHRLLNAYIDERKRASILLAQFDEEVTNEEGNKEIFDKYFTNKDLKPLLKYIYLHYLEDLNKIKEILNTIDNEVNLIADNFIHLTPLERMSLYQINMDYNDSK